MVLGLASSRRALQRLFADPPIIERAKPDLDADFHGRTLADAVLAPTRIYVKPLLALMQALPVKGMAHITGGGLVENIPRILRRASTAVLDRKRWPLPPLFQWLQREGNVADAEMHRVFNCGIGMVVVVAPEHERQAVELLSAAGEQVYLHRPHRGTRQPGRRRRLVV